MVIHVDMDAFYASVEERDNPVLRDKCVIVGGSPEKRGVVSTANYHARKFGVHSAMPAVTAKRLCPHAVFLPSRMDYYVQIALQIRAIFARYTPCFEPLSLDEAFLDVEQSTKLYGPEVSVAQRIQSEIKQELELTASIGVAPNKFLAKLASDHEKPNGFVVIEEKQIQQFLDPLPVKRLWGVGGITQQKLQALGIDTIEALRNIDHDLVRQTFGDTHAEHLLKLAHGRDDRCVTADHEAKSISQETTFADDISDSFVLRSVLLRLTEDVARRLREHTLYARTIHIKLRYPDFETITRSVSVNKATNSTKIIWNNVQKLFTTTHRKTHAFRLLGVAASGFSTEPQRQQDFFQAVSNTEEEKIDSLSDHITNRFGKNALRRGTGINALKR